MGELERALGEGGSAAGPWRGSDLFWLDGRIRPSGQLTCCVYAPALDNTAKVELKGGRALASAETRAESADVTAEVFLF